MNPKRHLPHPHEDVPYWETEDGWDDAGNCLACGEAGHCTCAHPKLAKPRPAQCRHPKPCRPVQRTLLEG